MIKIEKISVIQTVEGKEEEWGWEGIEIDKHPSEFSIFVHNNAVGGMTVSIQENKKVKMNFSIGPLPSRKGCFTCKDLLKDNDGMGIEIPCVDSNCFEENNFPNWKDREDD